MNVPTSDHNVDELEKFYSDLQSVMIKLKSSDVNIIMGDLNAKVGEGGEEGIVGDFGIGIRNERGERFENFCKENNLCIMNTYFELPKHRLYTYSSRPQAKPCLEKPDGLIHHKYSRSYQKY